MKTDKKPTNEKKTSVKKGKPTRKFWTIYGAVFVVGAIVLYLLGWVF